MKRTSPTCLKNISEEFYPDIITIHDRIKSDYGYLHDKTRYKLIPLKFTNKFLYLLLIYK